MTDAILEITDGTTIISLIVPSTGFHLTQWIPAITDYKGGGTFQNSPLADWRQLRDSKWDTAVENFTITINGQSPDTVAFGLQELRRLLEKANQYWTTDWQNTPVYVVARMKCETNTRYGLIVKGRLGNDRNFYSQPVTGRVTTLRDLPLVIERRAWLENVPGVSTAVAISASESYDGRNLGNYVAGAQEYTTSERVFIGNKFNEANLTDVYFYDDSLASFSSNLMDAALPFDLIPATAAISDILYLGIDTSVSDSGPFNNVIFRTSGTLSAGTTAWEYFDGATWSALSEMDRTDDGARAFELDGDFLSVAWTQASDWAATAINGITAFWIRLLFTATPTGTVEQVNQLVYSSVWSYVELESTSIPGDITALSISKFRSMLITTTMMVMLGLRSTSRGASFEAYINISDDQNLSGISVALGANTAFADSNNAPSGRVADYTPAGAEALATRATISFNSTITAHFAGKFHLYLRVANSTANLTTYTVQIEIIASDLTYTTQTILRGLTNVSPQGFQEIDFGEVTLPPFFNSLNSGGESAGFDIVIKLSSVNSSNNLELIDIILMPIDEWAGEFLPPENSSSISLIDRRLIIDSIVKPKIHIKSVTEDISTGLVDSIYQSIVNGPIILQANTKQRLWIRIAEGETTTDVRYWELTPGSILVEKTSRYLSLRGNR